MMARNKDRQKRIRHVGALEFNHPVLHFLTVRWIVWLGKVWLRLLTTKQHLWAMCGAGLLRRSVWFGPGQYPGHSRPAPILVLVGTARSQSPHTPAGDYEPVTTPRD